MLINWIECEGESHCNVTISLNYLHCSIYCERISRVGLSWLFSSAGIGIMKKWKIYRRVENEMWHSIFSSYRDCAAIEYIHLPESYWISNDDSNYLQIKIVCWINAGSKQVNDKNSSDAFGIQSFCDFWHFIDLKRGKFAFAKKYVSLELVGFAYLFWKSYKPSVQHACKSEIFVSTFSALR